MEYEYTTSTGYKIFYGILAAGLLGFTLFVPMSANNGGYNTNPVLIIIPILGLVGAALIILNLIKRKIVITDYSIKYITIWSSKEIVIKDIKGFRIGDKIIFIYPFDEHSPKLSIKDYLSIGDIKGFKNWLAENFKDLDKEEFEAAKSEILQDTSLGITAEDRELKYNNNKKYATWYSMVALFSFFAVIYIHSDSRAVCIALLLYPIPGILLVTLSNGLIRLYAKKNSAYNAIFIGLLLPAFALAVQSFKNTKFLNFSSLLFPAVVVAVVAFCVLFFVAIKKVKDNVMAQIICALVFSAAYGLGAASAINCDFDQAQPKVYPVKVIDHHVTHGKSTSYYITIDEWKEGLSESINVSSSFYDNTPVGSTVNVNLKPGTLNIPWYYISE